MYLTNSLTGWEPPKEPKKLLFPELAAERDAADKVKREAQILVVLGNPPYNAFAGVSPEEEQGLVEPYKEGLNTPVAEGGWGIKKFNLDDLYVRFFRLAERRIAEMTGKGVVSFISNFSYLGDPSFVVMRQRFLTEFDQLWFDCMNGDSRETGKLTPEGKPDPSVFSTEYNREGIRVGTAVCVIVRKEKREKKPRVRFRHFWGVTKRQDLLASLTRKRLDATYRQATPSPENRFSFQPSEVEAHYLRWPRMVDLCALPPGNGLMEKRGGSLIDINYDELAERMKTYFNKRCDWHEYCAIAQALTTAQARFDAQKARDKALSLESFRQDRIVRYALRPLETRWCYYTPVRPIWNEPRPSLWGQCWPGNAFLMTRPVGVASPEGVPFCYTRLLGDNDAMRGHAYYFPVQVRNGARLDKKAQRTLFGLLGEEPAEAPVANLSPAARDYLARFKIKNPDADAEPAGLVWMHALAVGYSPAYLAENADGIRRDWPRIPLPSTRKALEESAALGRQIAALLDTEADVDGVTAGRLEALFQIVGAVAKVGGGALRRRRRRSCRDCRLGARGQGGRDHARQGTHRSRTLRPGRTRSDRRGRPGPRASGQEGAFAARRNVLRRVLERAGLLEKRPGQRVGILHRRLSGHQEMAELPRAGTAGPPAPGRRGPRSHQHGAASGGDRPGAAGPGRQLPPRQGPRVPVAGLQSVGHASCLPPMHTLECVACTPSPFS